MFYRNCLTIKYCTDLYVTDEEKSSFALANQQFNRTISIWSILRADVRKFQNEVALICSM